MRFNELSNSIIDSEGDLPTNNPALVALIDSFSFNNEIRDYIKLLLVGTGKISQLPYGVNSLKAPSFTWLDPRKGPHLIEIIMHSQSGLIEKHIDFLAHKLKGQISYRRINPILNFKLNLDEYKNIELLKNLSDIGYDDLDWVLNNLP